MPTDLEALTLQELRRRRDAVREQEEDLSYLRRLLHAQVDIIGAVEGARDHEELERMLAEVLADAPPAATPDVRAVEVDERPEVADLEPLPDDLVDMSAEDRAALLVRLRAQEQGVSERRRALLDELDALQDELVRRFRRDGVDARALLGEDA